MSEHGGGASDPPAHHAPGSRLEDYAETTIPHSGQPDEGQPPGPVLVPTAVSEQAAVPESAPENPGGAARRQWFTDLLEEFRRTAVLVPAG